MTNKKRIVPDKNGSKKNQAKNRNVKEMRHLKETWQGKKQKESKNKTSKKTE